MNPLDQYPGVRRYLYMVQWVANGVLAVAGAYFAASSAGVDDLPHWYVLTLAVAPVLWTYLGVTAQSNVSNDGDVDSYHLED